MRRGAAFGAALTAALLAACAGMPTVPSAADRPANPAAEAPSGDASAVEAPAGVPAAEDLQMPASSFPGVTEARKRALAEDAPADGEGTVAPEAEVLRRSGLASAAQYRYVLGGERPAMLKVRVDVFRDRSDAVTQFRGRHLPEALAMTEPLAAGDDGFIYQDLYAGFRVAQVTVEIRADGPNGRLADFARAYADFVASRLGGARPGSPPRENR